MTGDVFVFGGAAVVSSFDGRPATRGVDAVWRPHGIVLEEAWAVAEELALPRFMGVEPMTACRTIQLPCSTVSTVSLHHFAADTEPADVSQFLARWGYAIVDDVVGDTVMDRLTEESMRWIDASDHGRDHYDGRFTRRTGMLIARCPTARELVTHPLALGVVGHFLAHATTFQLHLTQIISIEPGETEQKLHRDQMAFDFFAFPADYHVQCNTMWAMTDFTAANGATRIAPGTSAMDDGEAAAVGVLQADMRRGSVLFYEGKVVHGGGANRSNSVRRGVNITYAVGWVRQEENQYLACPPDIARTLDDDLLKVMGYQQGAFALGYVGDQQDPLAFLRGERGKVKVISEVQQRNTEIAAFVDELDADGRA